MKKFLIVMMFVSGFMGMATSSELQADRSETVHFFIHCHESVYATNDPRDTTSYNLDQFSNVFIYDVPISSSGRYVFDADSDFAARAKQQLQVEGKCFLEDSTDQDEINSRLDDMVQSHIQSGMKKLPPDQVKHFLFEP